MFSGKLVKLRPLELNDLDLLMEVWNNPELQKNLDGNFPVPRSYEEKFIRRTWENIAQRREFVYGLELIGDTRLIGSIGLHDIDRIDSTCMFGIAIYNSKDWGKGYGTDGTKLSINLAFNSLNIHRVELQVYSYNERAFHVYEKVGFKRVGVRRQARYWNGKYYDTIVMDILKDEWVGN